MRKTFLGYRRKSGAAGIRNHVAVISVMDNCNPVTRAVCNAVDGTLAVTTLFVRGQYGADLDIALNTLAGMGRNPNIAAVLLIGLEPNSSEDIAARIRPVGKPIEIVNLQPNGTISAIAEGTRKAMHLAIAASSLRREPCPVSDLLVGVECGGSDTTSGLTCNPVIGASADRIIDQGGSVIISETSEFFGAEHLFAARAVSAPVRDAFLGAVSRLETQAIARGVNIRGANPTADNMRGGLTTIEEKALGAMAKAGSRPLVGVLTYGEAPRERGLHFMDAPAPAVENLTALAAAGCQLILFGTGVGNPIGNMVAPTIKVCGNVNTLATMKDNIDFDTSDILEKGARIPELGEWLHQRIIDVASGTITTSEVLDVRETAISRFAPTI